MKKFKFSTSTKKVLIIVGLLLIIGGGIGIYSFLRYTQSQAAVNIPNAGDGSFADQQTLEIALESNPTTGYSWEYTVDGDALIMISKSHRSDCTETANVEGCGGQDIFTVVALGSGQSDITFNYFQPWEQNTVPSQSVIYHLTVSEDLRITATHEDIANPSPVSSQLSEPEPIIDEPVIIEPAIATKEATLLPVSTTVNLNASDAAITSPSR